MSGTGETVRINLGFNPGRTWLHHHMTIRLGLQIPNFSSAPQSPNSSAVTAQAREAEAAGFAPCC